MDVDREVVLPGRVPLQGGYRVHENTSPGDLAETELTQWALEVAIELGRASNAELRIVNVQVPLPSFYLDSLPPTYFASCGSRLALKAAPSLAQLCLHSKQYMNGSHWAIIIWESHARLPGGGDKVRPASPSPLPVVPWQDAQLWA